MRADVLILSAELAAGEDLIGKLIREAAIPLGAISGDGSSMPNGGDDGIQTPDWLAKGIVRHFLPAGRRLEPCHGNGAFCRAMPCCDRYDIAEGKDFMTAAGHWDWIVTNPPRSSSPR
jgi:hypothetical protein